MPGALNPRRSATPEVVPSEPKVIFEGSYRASDRERAYRIVRQGEDKVVETEETRDAMGGVVWSQQTPFNSHFTVEQTILKMLLDKLKL